MTHLQWSSGQNANFGGHALYWPSHAALAPACVLLRGLAALCGAMGGAREVRKGCRRETETARTAGVSGESRRQQESPRR